MNIQRPNNMDQRIAQLANIINSNSLSLVSSFNLLLDIIEEDHPGFKDRFEREKFYRQCKDIFFATKTARKGDLPNALEIIEHNTEVLEKMKKDAKARGWQSEYDKADRNSEHMIAEAEGPRLVEP